jgi:spoIIIJ-associated protein
MVNQRIRQWKTIVVDVDQYKERRVSQLTQLAERMADQVIKSGRAVSLEPMPANERRIVHLALRDHPTVYTQSSGEGERRKVHIVTRP